MVSFSFEFDKPDRKYKAGQIVSCIIRVSVSSKFVARSLLVRFKGFAHAEWTKTGSGSKNEQYIGHEVYFKMYQYMFGDQSSSEIEVAPGLHTYNASCKLPEMLPSNFEHITGHIRYSVKANYDIPYDFDKEGTVHFYVTPNIDLNLFPYLRQPIKVSEEKIFGCLCWESKPLYLSIILPRTGYIVGETIPITIGVDNNSNVRIDSVCIELKEYLTFVTHNSGTTTRSDTTTINEHSFRIDVAAFEKKEFETSIYLDPSYDFKLLYGCGIMTCEYHIKLKAKASGCHAIPDIFTTVFIGTVPFNEITSNGVSNPIASAVLAPMPNSVVSDANSTPDSVIVDQPSPLNHDIGLSEDSEKNSITASKEKVSLNDDFQKSEHSQEIIVKPT